MVIAAINVDDPQVLIPPVRHHVAEMTYIDNLFPLGGDLSITGIFEVEDVHRPQGLCRFCGARSDENGKEKVLHVIAFGESRKLSADKEDAALLLWIGDHRYHALT